jgi:hypothetical protein
MPRGHGGSMPDGQWGWVALAGWLLGRGLFLLKGWVEARGSMSTLSVGFEMLVPLFRVMIMN